MKKSNNLTVIILAAGSSSRLGEAKQLLKLGNESLIQIAVKKALELSNDVNVILGSRSTQCQKELESFNIKSFFNKDYKKGMGTSLSFGVSKITNTNRILVMLCDMPLIPISHFEKLIKSSDENENLIVCSKYNEKLGVPTIFPRKYFKMLESLTGDKGAKEILKSNPLVFLELEANNAIDIDTKEDLSSLLPNR